MHVLQISFFVDRQRRSPERLLQDWYTLEDTAAAVASAGERVTVVQASMVEGEVSRRGVDFSFIAPDAPDALLAQSTTFRSRLREARARRRARARPRLRTRGARAARAASAGSDPAPRPCRSRAAALASRAVEARRGRVDGVSFCARAQSELFARAGMLPPHVHVFEIPESTSRFVPGDASAAREVTGLHGDPAVLWVGHLDRNKDPLTVLEGVARAVADLPAAHALVLLRIGAGPAGRRGSDRARSGASRPRASARPGTPRADRDAHACGRSIRARQPSRRRQHVADRGARDRLAAGRDRHPVVALAARDRRRRHPMAARRRALAQRCAASGRCHKRSRDARASSRPFRRARLGSRARPEIRRGVRAPPALAGYAG